MTFHLRIAAAIPLAASMVWAGAAFSADQVLTNRSLNPQPLSSAAIAGARAFVNPLATPDTASVRADSGAAAGMPGVFAGSDDVAAGGGVQGRAFGSFGIPYTSTRVQLGGTLYKSVSMGPAYLGTTSPYRTVGKLTFSAGFCSASVILRGVIVTAAHCIQNFASGGNIFSGFTFTPGHYGAAGATVAQMAPYNSWSWHSLVRPASWANGTDIGCGAARDNDLAVIALNKDGKGRFVGDRVGSNGYGWNNYSSVVSAKTGNMRTFATSTLGYPALLDLGRVMQRADGPSFTTTVCGAGQIWQGSNFTGGSSGGPWIVNFVSFNAARSGGAALGTAPIRAVIGVTSWGSADPNAPKDNYSSQFRQNSAYPNGAYGNPNRGAGNIGSLLATLCQSGNPTLQSQGYCD